MATQQVIQPYSAGSLIEQSPKFWGGPENPDVKETASQTYGVADLLYFDTNGTIAIATVDGGSPTLLNSEVAGQAVKAATGTTGTSVLFRVILATDLFFINVYHVTLGSSVGALTDIGDEGTIAKASSVWRLSKDAGAVSSSLANGHVKIVGYPLRHPAGGVVNAITDTHALLTVHFNVWSMATDGNPNQKVLTFG